MSLHALCNDAIRSTLRLGIQVIGLRMERELGRAIARYPKEQRALAARYGIRPDTPLRGYDDEVRRSVEAFAATRGDVRFAYTSGSTSQPKKIAFTPERLAANKRGSLSVVSRLMRTRRVRSAQLFVFSGLKQDDSLSSLLLDNAQDRAPRIKGLLMPARYLMEPGLRELVPTYGATAARLFLLVLSNPGVLYSTNPSTLALFLTDLYTHWPAATALVRRFVEGDRELVRALSPVLRAVASAGFEERLRRVASAVEPLPFEALAPACELYCCWDGGYVRPFLAQIQRYLPAERYTHIPMYSMATETVQTLNHFDGEHVRFLPIAEHVLYEFLPEGAPDDPRLLVPAFQLEPEHNYTMVVSDPYGLVRYHTEDVFRCVARVGAAPDLRFLRRRGLNFSFTGEKLTDHHVSEAVEHVRKSEPELTGIQFTCIPSRPAGALIPAYRLVLAPAGGAPALALPALARAFDEQLGKINTEYGDKRASGRLGVPSVHVIAYDDLAAQLDPKSMAGEEAQRGWDTQFKLLPLLTRTWEELRFPALSG
jgi:hypothetical protein